MLEGRADGADEVWDGGAGLAAEAIGIGNGSGFGMDLLVCLEDAELAWWAVDPFAGCLEEFLEGRQRLWWKRGRALSWSCLKSVHATIYEVLARDYLDVAFLDGVGVECDWLRAYQYVLVDSRTEFHRDFQKVAWQLARLNPDEDLAFESAVRDLNLSTVSIWIHRALKDSLSSVETASSGPTTSSSADSARPCWRRSCGSYLWC